MKRHCPSVLDGVFAFGIWEPLTAPLRRSALGTSCFSLVSTRLLHESPKLWLVEVHRKVRARISPGVVGLGDMSCTFGFFTLVSS